MELVLEDGYENPAGVKSAGTRTGRGKTNGLYGRDAVAALAIDKAGPRPCHFRPGPTSGPATRLGSQKVKSPLKKIQYV